MVSALFVRRDPVNLLFHGSLLNESATLEDRFAVLDHLGMPTEVRNCVAGIKIPMVGIFAEDVVCPPDLSAPIGVIPRPAHGGNVFKPGQFSVKLVQLFEVPEFKGPAGAVQQVELMRSVEAAFPPFFGERAHVADEWSDTGNRRNQQMIPAPVV